MSDDTLSNKEMDFWTEAAEADTRAVVERNARIARESRIEAIKAGLRKVLPLVDNPPQHLSTADIEFARTLQSAILAVPSDAQLAAAEGFLANLRI